MNHYPSREQVQALRERYPPGTMIQLTADMQGERFRAGDIGKVTSVDDAGQIHLAWLKGGSLAIIPGVDSFREIITEPLDLNPYLENGNLRINGYYVDACTDNGIERADAWGKTEIFTANGVAQIVVLSIVTSVIKAFGDPEPGTSRLAGGLMMAIYVGATAGGMFLTCSNGPNVIIVELSEAVTGEAVSFFQWSLFGIPCGAILLVFSAWLLPRYYRPESLSEGQRAQVEALFETIPSRLEVRDIKYLIIMGCMVALWFSSNWLRGLDVATIALGGVVVMMLPGIDLLSAKDFKRNFSIMNAIILLCIFPMAAGMSTTGAGEWIAERIFAGAAGWGKGALIALATLTAFLIHCFVPAGSANATLSVTVIAPVLVAAGIPAPAAIMIIGIQAGTGFLFPIEGTWQYTFGTEYYTFSDCIKGNWPITLVGMLCCVLVIPLLSFLYSVIGIL